MMWVLGVKNIILELFRLFSLKRATMGAFAVPFRVLSPKKMIREDVLCKNWYLLWAKKNSSYVHKTGFSFLLGVLFKISNKHPLSLYMGLSREVVKTGSQLALQNCQLEIIFHKYFDGSVTKLIKLGIAMSV